MIYLSVVIPAYNEEDNIKAQVLNDIDQYLKKQSFLSEIIIVDDGSTDRTPVLLEKLVSLHKNWKLIKNSHQGKSASVKTGVLSSKGQLILYTDFDQATPISEIEKLLPFVQKGYQIIIGSREIKGSKRKGEPWYRHIMGKGFNFVVQLLAVKGIQDTQCGFKLFEKQTARNLFNSLVIYTNDHLEKTPFTGAFDVELLYIARKRKYKIAEVPVSWHHVHSTRVGPIRDSIRMFLDVLRIRLADLTGKY